MCTFKITKDFEHYNNFTYDNQKLSTPSKKQGMKFIHQVAGKRATKKQMFQPASLHKDGATAREKTRRQSRGKNQCSSPGPTLEEGAAGTFPREWKKAQVVKQDISGKEWGAPLYSRTPWEYTVQEEP